MQKDNFPEFTEWQKTHDMPEGFSNSSWHNDVFPSISNENGTVYVWFQSVEGFVSELDGKIADFNKYYIQMHETDEIYGLDNYEDPKYSELYTNDWNEVLNAIKGFNNLKILEKSNDISTHIDIYKSFISYYSSIGIDLSDGDASEVLYALTPKDCQSESQYKYIVDFLKRFIDIWESKEF